MNDSLLVPKKENLVAALQLQCICNTFFSLIYKSFKSATSAKSNQQLNNFKRLLLWTVGEYRGRLISENLMLICRFQIFINEFSFMR